MSKNLPDNKVQSEEVDLGQLFKAIGNMFDRLFMFIKVLFLGFYKLLILFLIHLNKRLFWYLSVLLIGIVLGFFLDKNSEKLYGANMFIQTNYGSARQVYENIKQFQELANVDKDSVELGERLGISTSKASKLKGFYIEPDLDENDIAEMYSSFYSRLDSVSRLEMDYGRYKKSLTPYNYTIHRIGVASTDKKIYPDIESAFVKQISSNYYLNELLSSGIETFDKRDQSLLNQIKRTDSLANEYLKIRLNESQKERPVGSGTNLYMGDAESSAGSLIVDESQVITRRLAYEKERIVLDSIKATKSNIINVIASFPSSGYDAREWYDKKVYLLPLLFFSLTFFIFMFLSLREFLKKQNN